MRDSVPGRASVAEELGRAGRYLAQGLRLMVGLPDYDAYLRHMQSAHPGEPAMSYEEFFRERQQARYGGADGQVLASAIFGDYTSLVYLTPILGGFLADRWLGRRAALVAGAVVMSLGHFMMAFEGAFLFALATLIVGVGLFKGNIASQVGELYSDTDIRRAMAFQIFYIAINVSVIAAPLVSGTLGEKMGWHWGFGTAGIVMVVGLLLYIYAKPWLPADNRPSKSDKSMPREKLMGKDWLRLLAVLLLVPALAIALLINQQIFNAYGNVSDSFRFLMNSWTTIINLISIYQRLRGFERQIPKDGFVFANDYDDPRYLATETVPAATFRSPPASAVEPSNEIRLPGPLAIVRSAGNREPTPWTETSSPAALVDSTNPPVP